MCVCVCVSVCVCVFVFMSLGRVLMHACLLTMDFGFMLQELSGPRAKALAELNTEEVCQWFSSIGLHKCLPLIRGKDLPPPCSSQGKSPKWLPSALAKGETTGLLSLPG